MLAGRKFETLGHSQTWPTVELETIIASPGFIIDVLLSCLDTIMKLKHLKLSQFRYTLSTKTE
jgi:hypothetical protein